MSLVNSLQCRKAKDECRRTSKYKKVGQNMYELCSSSNYSPPELVIDWAIRSWFDAHNAVSAEEDLTNTSFGAMDEGEDFLQLVKSNSDRIGCSVVKYRDARKYRCTLVGCNYNTGAMAGQPTYAIGKHLFFIRE